MPRTVRKRGASSSSSDAAVQRVLALVDSIPRGRVSTYGSIAVDAGLPRRARFVGRVLREFGGSELAWHRVVNASGASSLAGASAREQRRRLAREGVVFARNGRIDLARYLWRP